MTEDQHDNIVPVKDGDSLSQADSKAWRARQQARANMMALVLVALCVLFFAITIVKLSFAG